MSRASTGRPAADPDSTDDGGKQSRRIDASMLAELAAPLALVLVWLAFFIATPDFLTTDNISDLLVASSILVVLALGQQFAVVVADAARRSAADGRTVDLEPWPSVTDRLVRTA